jgi:hypothetical protein
MELGFKYFFLNHRGKYQFSQQSPRPGGGGKPTAVFSARTCSRRRKRRPKDKKVYKIRFAKACIK